MDGFKYLENACVGYGCKLYNVGQGCLVSYTLYFIHAYPVSHVLGIGATSKASGNNDAWYSQSTDGITQLGCGGDTWNPTYCPLTTKPKAIVTISTLKANMNRDD